jgi:hypothetical protein
MLHGGALTLDMDMVMLWRHFKDLWTLFEHFLAQFLEAIPF